MVSEKILKILKELFDAMVDFFKPTPEPLPPEEMPPNAPPALRTLEKGMTGDDVKSIQKKLFDLGYTLEIDGSFGNETERTVINFQRDNAIGQTGRVGPQTLAAILAAKAKESTEYTNRAVMLNVAKIAEREAKRGLVWNGLNSEAEKFLAPLRKAIGAPSGRFSWCGGFVYWCCKEGGVAIPLAFKTGYTPAYCPGWENWARAENIWFDASLPKKDFNPRTGDIVLFNWDGDKYADHIGIVLSYAGGRIVVCAEGNTSNTSAGSQTNGNSTAVRERDWGVIKGFIRLDK